MGARPRVGVRLGSEGFGRRWGWGLGGEGGGGGGGCRVDAIERRDPQRSVQRVHGARPQDRHVSLMHPRRAQHLPREACVAVVRQQQPQRARRAARQPRPEREEVRQLGCMLRQKVVVVLGVLVALPQVVARPC